jgi:hypothetical protein
MFTGVAIFALTYALIAGRRLSWLPLDRPAGALLGAVLMVAFGVLAPREAIESINGETLLLLFGLMGIGGFLASDGFLDRSADWLAARCGTASHLLGALVWGAGILAVITNDAVRAGRAAHGAATEGARAGPFLLACARPRTRARSRRSSATRRTCCAASLGSRLHDLPAASGAGRVSSR